VSLLTQKQSLRTQQHRTFGDLRIGGGTGRQGLCGSRARSAWTCFHESSACVRSSGARLRICAVAPAAKALRLPSALDAGLFLQGQCLRTQQRRAFGDLRIGGVTGRRGLCGSRARLARTCLHESSACARSSGARLGSYAAAPAIKAFAAPERAWRGLILAGAAFKQPHVGGGTGRRGFGASRARSARGRSLG
jgi:hypothetical protein